MPEPADYDLFHFYAKILSFIPTLFLLTSVTFLKQSLSFSFTPQILRSASELRLSYFHAPFW